MKKRLESKKKFKNVKNVTKIKKRKKRFFTSMHKTNGQYVPATTNPNYNTNLNPNYR